MINARRILSALPGLVVAAALGTPALAQDPARALSLGDAARLAAQRSTASAVSRLRADEVRSRVAQRRADLLPSLAAVVADGERTYNTASFGIPFPGFDPNGSIIGPVRTVDVRARLALDVFDPAARARYRGAQAVADSAGAGETTSAEQAGFVAAVAYLRVLRADAQLGARAADSASAAQLLGIARDQLAAGVGVALDVTRAESQVASSHAQIIAARNERDQARLALRRALGISLTAALVLKDSLQAPAGTSLPDAAQAIAEALRSRSELRAAAAAVTSAQRARDAARAGRVPSLGLYADEGASSNQYNHLLQTYSYGVQLAFPVFEGGRTEARIEEQSAALRESELRLADLRQQVEVDVRSALLDIAAAEEQVAAAGERLRLAEAETAQARERFSAGVSGNADVVSALLSLTGSRTQLVDAQTALRSAWVAMARAQGRVTELP
jgi:outer membrane protein TolC